MKVAKSSPIVLDVITLFPEMFSALTEQGVVRRAFELGLVDLTLTNPREFASNAYKTVDDRPYGGGPGMVMMAPPLAAAIRSARARHMGLGCAPYVVYMSPQGAKLTQTWVGMQLEAMHVSNIDTDANSISQINRAIEQALPRSLIVLCGRYEAIDERLFEMGLIDEELSIGDVVLSGGELAAMVMLDALLRCVPEVLNDQQSAAQDSFSEQLDGLLDCTHYTRPEVFENFSVPEVLLSGNHAKIAVFRRQMALKNTWKKRPDLIIRAREQGFLSVDDEKYLQQLVGNV
ncbi:MAG: tRNA (guanine(37)-N(1))-methyltransferase [Burkholderiales bacterium]|nr:tRNA (guanine(37)-N(1))-methyltransferase [Burkholderiales bacterium]